MGENGGAAGGEVVVGEKDVEVAEGIVDALGGLETLVIERRLEIENVGFLKLLDVRVTKDLVWGLDGKLAAATRGCAVLAAGGFISGIGVGGYELSCFFSI